MAGIGVDSLLCKECCFDDEVGSDPAIITRFPFITTDDFFCVMVERQDAYLPNQDYLLRLRSGLLDLNSRREAFDWISKAHAYLCFTPLSFCLSMNYFDRFLSLHDLPKDRTWAVQLLAVACLSLAVKMEETNVPHPTELQVADPKFVFEGKTIQRMELLVLTTLNWQMNAITPFSFVDYFLSKLSGGDDDDGTNPVPANLINKSFQLILCTTRGIDFLEFKPSEVAAAVAVAIISVTAGEIQTPPNIDRVMHLHKGSVVNKCVELIRDLSLMRWIGEVGSSGLSSLPDSPNGVLEAMCFSNTTTDDITTPQTPPDNKRKKLHHTAHSSNS